MRKGLRRLTAFGIFRCNSVKVRNKDEKGIVKENPKKGKVIVRMKRTKKEKDFKITELQCRPNVSQWPRVQYYPDHLPNLGREESGLLKLRYKDGKVYVKIWYIRDSQKNGQMHANIMIDRGLQMSVSVAGKWCGNVIDEAQTFSRKTQLPCHLIEKKLVIFQDTAFIHKDTDVNDIKELLELGISVLQIGENEDNEDDINYIMYFRRLIEYFCGKNCMPVIISINDGFKKDSKNECIRHYPVLSFKYKDVVDVFTFNEEKQNERKITIHSFCKERPWICTLKTEFNSFSNIDSSYIEKKSLLDILPFSKHMDVFICHLVIGVFLKLEKADMEVFEKNTNRYANAFTVFLLKKGMFQIPNKRIIEHLKISSLHLIYEENITEKLKDGLCWNLQDLSAAAYSLPKNDEEEEKSNLYGFIFYALLDEEYYEGALQFFALGKVKIQHLLAGCYILKKKENNWRAAENKKERMQNLQRFLSHLATRSIMWMDREMSHDADKKQQQQEKKNSEYGKRAGHLLLNEGCLSDAIRTQNKSFLSNDTVNDIVRQIWYGYQKTSISQWIIFLTLACLHGVFLPLLMITTKGPMKWFYKQYRVPTMKAVLNMVGMFALLFGLAYTLLFDFGKSGFSSSDIFNIVMMTSFLLSEIKQAAVAIKRQKFQKYLKDTKNWMDWLAIITYFLGIFLKTEAIFDLSIVPRICFVSSFVVLCMKNLSLFSKFRLIGPKLVMLQRTLYDTFPFLVIMVIISICYSVSYHGLLYTEDFKLNYSQVLHIVTSGIWILFGEVFFDNDNLKEPFCSHNKTIFDSGEKEPCPSSFGFLVSPYIKAAYCFVTVILLLNLLIAMYSDTYSKVQEDSEFHWSKLQADSLEEYTIKSIFPLHLELPAMIIFIFRILPLLVKALFSRDHEKVKVKKNQAICSLIKVFIYDIKFDDKIKEVEEAEETAIMKTKREWISQRKDSNYLQTEQITEHE